MLSHTRSRILADSVCSPFDLAWWLMCRDNPSANRLCRRNDALFGQEARAHRVNVAVRLASFIERRGRIGGPK